MAETTHRTACPLDCPDACSLLVTVDGGRVTRLAGTADNPVTAEFLCGKVRRFDRHLYCDERIARPAIRHGAKGSGAFVDTGWDEALDLIAERLRDVASRSGGEAILPLSYGGSNGLLTQDTADAALFDRLGSSRLLRTVCAAPTGRAATGLYGKMVGVAYPDYEAARLIVIWGQNPSASSVHLVPIIQRARRRGARLVVVDPRRTPLAAQADLHLPVRPGTDLALALAVIRWLFTQGRADLGFLEAQTLHWEALRSRADDWSLDTAADTCGLEVEEIRLFAEWYATTSPAVIRCGWGLERSRSGGSAVAAVLALPAVGGKFGVRGGGYTMSNSGAWRYRPPASEGAAPRREINMNRVGHELLERRDPALEALFVYNCNPLATLPNQELVRRGLAREDLFTVVFDQVWTDTTQWADVVLPATTFLEHHDLSQGYGALVIQRVTPVIEPVQQARSNLTVFSSLLARLDLSRPGDVWEPHAVAAEILGRSEDASLAKRLGETGPVAPAVGASPVQFVDTFPRTSDGKIHLLPADLEAETPQGLYRLLPNPQGGPDRPLSLISPASSRTVSSTFGQLQAGLAALEMHPADARRRQLEDGDRARVFNDLGEVRVPVRVSDRVRPGVVSLPKGLWASHTLNGATANALAPDHLADLGQGACFNDARVEVERL